MQMGQAKFEMQTMNQALADLFMRKMINYDDAISRSSSPDELNEMIASREPQTEGGTRATGTQGPRVTGMQGGRYPQTQKPPYRNR
jgi:twitching motility protein PilT